MTSTTRGKGATQIRKGQPDPALNRSEFMARFRQRFFDPAFDDCGAQIDALGEIAWQAYDEGRKSPRTSPAGEGYQDPDFDLSDEWRAASAGIAQAEKRQSNPNSPTRILVICASPRSEHTCPGEMSKSYRLVETVRAVVTGSGCECDVLELNRQTSEYGRRINPCKGCVSTAMPLCHWPCSCYPNHALDQSPDWMAEIYAQWSAAHGVLIVTPVHWEQAPSVLKLMIDRLVCADGGNTDPTSTHGKDPARAKAIEMAGWDYPQHLAGRAFALVVHGDTEGVQTLRRSLADWLAGMGLVDCGFNALLDRYIGYYEPYATSHAALDKDEALVEEVRNAARALLEQVRRLRSGEPALGAALHSPRQK
ncbi:MAG: NAD(P)H-dependent oxidoreductase [Luteimonas sp.]